MNQPTSPLVLLAATVLTPVFALGSAPSAVAQDLVARYDFEEGTAGGQIYDSSGEGNDGTWAIAPTSDPDGATAVTGRSVDSDAALLHQGDVMTTPVLDGLLSDVSRKLGRHPGLPRLIDSCRCRDLVHESGPNAV